MAGIIKSDGRPQTRATVVAEAFNFDDLSTRGQRYLEGIRQQAAQLVAQAQQEADAIRQQAMQQGRRDAVREAENSLHEKIERQLSFLVPSIREVVARIDRQRDAWICRWEQNVVHLAIAIAERVIRRQLSETPEITLDLLREALQLVSGGGHLKVYLNPTDLESLNPSLQSFSSQLSGVVGLEFIGDAAITSGGCRVDSEFGSIDQQLEVQLERIYKELTEVGEG